MSENLQVASGAAKNGSNTSVSGRWSSNWSYVLAAAGAAVGLGNIWKFPYMMGENGGGAFLVVYLLCIALIGVPVMMAEVMIGKRGRSTPANSVAKWAKESGVSKFWAIIGAVGVLSGFLILTFYSVIAGWAVDYVFASATGTFTELNGNADKVGAIFGELLGNPVKLIGFMTAIIVPTVWVVAKGVKGGLEKAVVVMMPAMLALLGIVMVYSAATGAFGEAAAFMFQPDFSKLTAAGALAALGHAFFTLSLSSGIMMMYGAFLPEGTSIARTSIWIAIVDTVVAIMAGLAIFPIVFANGLEPAAGPGLLFVTLPVALGQMPAATLMATLFFVMVVFAAFTSAIALLDSTVEYLVERRGFARLTAAITTGAAVWIIGLGTVYSLAGAEWAQVGFGGNIFDTLDQLTSKFFLPLGGLATAVFIGWIVNQKIVQEELNLPEAGLKLFNFCIRILAPVSITVVFIQSLM